jgi:hypothetical protein
MPRKKAGAALQGTKRWTGKYGLCSTERFGFLFNIGGLEGTGERISGHTVARATPQQVTVIKDALQSCH